MRRFLLWFLIVLAVLSLLGLAGCSFSLAGDVTPPPGWQPTPVPPTPDTSSLYPALPPDPVAGQAIYTQHCQKCHGPHGQGDGPEARRLGISPADLTDLDEAQGTPWVQRFLTVTHGKINGGMPPFAQTLTPRQRWDVLAYVYTLAVPQAAFEQGKALYQQRCQKCHGPRGQEHQLTAQSHLAPLSDADIAQAITGPQHPPEVPQNLNAEDRLALAAYVRSLSLASPPAAAAAATTTPAAATGAPTATPAATPQASPTSPKATVTITGQVTNGTPGGTVPPDLEVTLHAYDNATQAYTDSTKIDADGHFTFKQVPNAANRIFFVVTKYRDVLYGSQTVHIPAGKNTVDLPLTIYETTTDHSQLQVERLHVFAGLNGQQTLQVVEIYVITNNGDKTVVGDQPNAPVLEFTLPTGATHIQFEDGDFGNRYVQTDGGFGDLQPLYPQRTGQEVFAYDLPFPGKRLEISHPVPLPVAGAVIMVPQGELTVSGGKINDHGTQSDAQGTTYHVYDQASLKAGESLAFTVARANAGGLSGLLKGPRTSIAIGLMAIGAALIAIAVVLTQRERAAAPTPAPAPADDNPDLLMDAILALDDLYREGKLEEEAYRKRRAALKARLKAALAAAEGQEAPTAAAAAEEETPPDAA